MNDDSDVCSRLLTVCQQLAATHSSLHRLTALVGSPAAAADWQRQLAESALLDYEDEMEAHYLLVHKANAKFAGKYWACFCCVESSWRGLQVGGLYLTC